MNYQHRYLDGSACALPVGKAVCVGLNYAAHVAEMNSQRSQEPLLFIKPTTALCHFSDPIGIPRELGACHFETEMTVLIGDTLQHCDEHSARIGIAGIGVALDLTLRDLQDQLKKAGHPWEKSKGWDGACPTSPFLKPELVPDLQSVRLQLRQNGELRQDGNTAQMLTPVLELICYISKFFTLLPGDVVLTGTPAGVGPIQPGDHLEAELINLIKIPAGPVISR